MRGGHASPALRHVRQLFGGGTIAGLSDGELLERFIARGDALAFEALLTRHGPMVLAVCRGVLRDDHAADDAFQATFLILVRKARSIHVGDSLGRWLHGVSRRVAVRAGRDAARRRGLDLANAGAISSVQNDDVERAELGSALHEEIGRLPASYRDPILACYFEGLTHEGAAARLRWPVGTVKGRLSRGRRLLRDRLARRGLGLSAGMIGSALALDSARAAVSPRLIASTLRAATGFAAPRALLAAGTVPPASVALANGVLKAMTWTKLTAALSAVLISAAAVGAGVHAASDGPGGPATIDGAPAERATRQAQATEADGDARADEQAFVSKNLSDIEDEMRTVEREVAELDKQVTSAMKNREKQNRYLDHLKESRRQFVLRLDALKRGAPLAPEAVDPNLRPGSPPIAPGSNRPAITTRVYAVADLVLPPEGKKAPANDDFAPLIELIQSSVSPGTWKPSSDDPKVGEGDRVGTMTPFFLNASLIVRHTPEAHDKLVQFLRQLRRLRGLSQPKQESVPLDPNMPNASGPAPKIEPGDTLSVEIKPSSPLAREVVWTGKVEENGSIPLGPTGRIRAAGFTAPELQNLLVQFLRKSYTDEALGLTFRTEGGVARIGPEGTDRVRVKLVQKGPRKDPLPTPADRDTKAGEPKPTGSNRIPSASMKDEGFDSYIVEPPDRLDVTFELSPTDRPISGGRLVRPDGTITLDAYGDVHVAGLTVKEIKDKVVVHLRQHFSDRLLGLVAEGDPPVVVPTKTPRVRVRVLDRNSKFYYVLGEVGAPGRYPATGHETVLDALQYAGGLKAGAESPQISLVRPSPPGTGHVKPMNVDLDAIMMRGITATNYQLLPGDRLLVTSAPGARAEPPADADGFVTRSYAVGDLISRSPQASEGFSQDQMRSMNQLIQMAVEPGTWGIEPDAKDRDGRRCGHVRFDAKAGTLSIEHTAATHAKIAELLETLRRLRGLTGRTGLETRGPQILPN